MAVVNLVKGQRVNLTQQFNGQTKWRVGISWDLADGKTFDLDVMALLLTDKVANGGRVINEDFTAAYFSNDPSRPNFDKIVVKDASGQVTGFKSIDGSVVHMGDNRDGAGNGDDEVIKVDLSKVDPRVKSILFLVNIYTEDDPSKNYNFGMVKNATIRLYEADSDVPSLVYELQEDFSVEHNLEFAELYLHTDNSWRLNALGEGTNLSFADELKKFGIPC